MNVKIGNLTVENKDIYSVKITRRSDPTSLTLPTDSCNCVMRLNTQTAEIFKHNAKFRIFDEKDTANEYQGAFFVNEVVRLTYGKYEVKGYSYLGVLGEIPYKGRMFISASGGGISAADAFKTIDAGIDTSAITSYNYIGYIDNCTKREAIQKLCLANGFYAVIDRDSFIKILPYNAQLPEIIPRDKVFYDYKISEALNGYSSYSADVYSFSTSATGKDADDYVKDETTGIKYYYTKTKKTVVNNDYPAELPKNELYISGDTTMGLGVNVSRLLNNINEYYKGYNLEFKAVYNVPDVNSACFIENISGRGTEIAIGGKCEESTLYYGKENVQSYIIPYADAYTLNSKDIQCQTADGTILKEFKVYMHPLERETVNNDIITDEVAYNFRNIYIPQEKQTLINYTDVSPVIIVYDKAITQYGDTIELYAADSATQIEDTIEIGV